MTVKDLGLGRIIWFGSLIVGITGATLDEKYNECEVYRLGGNPLDWELRPNSPEMEEELKEMEVLEENGYDDEDDEEDGEAW